MSDSYFINEDNVVLALSKATLSFCNIRGRAMNGYMKITEASEKWGIGERRINTLCLQGRIEGAIKFGNTWAIPSDTNKPKDERIKTGKYIKKQ